MIDRYFKEGIRKEGFTLFLDLLKSGIWLNKFTFSGVLSAYVDHAVKELCKQVHGYMMRIGFDPSSFVVSMLVHRYTESGNTKNARQVYNGMPRPDLVS